MKTSFKYFIALCLSVATFASCSKSDDPTPVPVVKDPTITINKPTANQIFTVGTTINFEAMLKDDVKLKSYTVKIAKSTSDASATPFTYSKAGDISGTSYTSTLDIPIPASAATGTYNVEVTCTNDGDKKVTKTVSITINPVAITDQSDPAITIKTPTDKQIFTVGDKINFEATLTDDLKLKSYAVKIEKSTSDAGATPFTFSKAEDITTGDLLTYTSTIEIAIPTSATTGDYKVEVTCTDDAGKITTKSISITIDPVVVVDQSIPTIDIKSPTPNQAFTNGTAITFETAFADDVNLKSYTVTISKVATVGMVLKNVPVSTPFTYSKEGDISGTSYTLTLTDINIPLNTTTTITTPGDYTVTVTCKDAAGKDAISKSVVIKIS